MIPSCGRPVAELKKEEGKLFDRGIAIGIAQLKWSLRLRHLPAQLWFAGRVLPRSIPISRRSYGGTNAADSYTQNKNSGEQEIGQQPDQSGNE
jgi:hypothetical protein